MNKLDRIIVVFDQKHETQTAMLRALELSKLTQASIHIIATIFSKFNYSDGEMMIETLQILRENIQSRLNSEIREYIGSLDAAGVDITFESIWSNHPHEDIAQLCEKEHFDLLIKTSNKHGRFDGILHTPLDWHLLRECPCPVLLVSDDLWPEGSSIVAAIDANTNDQAHSDLNKQLLSTANYLGGILNNTVYAVNACPPLPVLIDLEYTSIDPTIYINNMHEMAKKNTFDIIKNFNIEKSHIKVIDGIPEDVIPEIAEQLESRLIILGTVSRTGLKGYIMGNTAEQLLHNINCDVLALKPDGFQYKR